VPRALSLPITGDFAHPLRTTTSSTLRNAELQCCVCPWSADCTISSAGRMSCSVEYVRVVSGSDQGPQPLLRTCGHVEDLGPRTERKNNGLPWSQPQGASL
jgi:hypothetical protein